MSDAAPRICIITSGHLASTPRMVKAADAFHEAGHRVRVVSASYHAASRAIDAEIRKTRRWSWHPVGLDRATAPGAWLESAMRQRVAARIADWKTPQKAGAALLGQAFGRAHGALLRAAMAEPADLFYGGTAAGLAAAALAARAQGEPYALDLEDFHSDEQDDSPEARRAHAIIGALERDLLPGAAFLTTGSEAMAEAYARAYGIKPATINNVFPLRAEPPRLEPAQGEALKLYWFSQTAGPGRGIEDAVRAVGIAGIAAELRLRGHESPGYIKGLRATAAREAPRLSIIHQPPEPPDPIDLCRASGCDVGLALEQTHVFNRTVCLTNKCFTYMQAGFAVAFTKTPGQEPIARDMGEGAIVYDPGDTAALARGLKLWAEDRSALARAKAASWGAAQRRWHWEHPEERGALLEMAERALAGRGAAAHAGAA